MAAALRDTDADWRHLGDTEPYWGVFSLPAYKSDSLTPQTLDGFYAAGRADIDHIARACEQGGFGPLRANRALDFGCGVGRLAEAMTAYADHVTGFDISPGMLETARRRGLPNIDYVGELPAGPFDWINSYLVFQHIPPERGVPLMVDLVDRLAPGGFLSLQMTTWTEAGLRPTKPRLRDRLRALVVTPPPPPTGTMLMHDYDLGEVVERLQRRGFGRMLLVHTDHGGHHGVQILARRKEDA